MITGLTYSIIPILGLVHMSMGQADQDREEELLKRIFTIEEISEIAFEDDAMGDNTLPIYINSTLVEFLGIQAGPGRRSSLKLDNDRRLVVADGGFIFAHVSRYYIEITSIDQGAGRIVFELESKSSLPERSKNLTYFKATLVFKTGKEVMLKRKRIDIQGD